MEDLKFEKVWFKIGDFNPADGIQTDQIREVAISFLENIGRSHEMIGFIPRLVNIGRRDRFAEAQATFNQTGRLELTKEERVDEALVEAINKEKIEIIGQEQLLDLSDAQRLKGFITDGGTTTMKLIHFYHYQGSSEIESILINMLFNAWAAFEVMSVDLWVVALNFGPKDLAESVIRSAMKEGLKPEMPGRKKGETAAEEKTVALSILKNYSYDLRTKMGNVMADEGKVHFESFTNTIRAYGAAFGPESLEILNKRDADCGNVALLQAARNILIHRGGRIDVKFRDKIKHATGSTYHHLRTLADGEKFPIDGPMVKTLVESTMRLAKRLLLFVDSRTKADIIEYEI